MNKEFLNEQALEFIKQEQNLFFSNYAGAEGIIKKLLETGECITTINIGVGCDIGGGIFNFIKSEFFDGGVNLYKWSWKHSILDYKNFNSWLDFQKQSKQDEADRLQDEATKYVDLLDDIEMNTALAKLA